MKLNDTDQEATLAGQDRGHSASGELHSYGEQSDLEWGSMEKNIGKSRLVGDG